MRNKIILISGFLFIIDWFLLLYFGKTYTTTILIQPFFYVHDVVLGVLFIICITWYKHSIRIKSIEILIVISLLYLLGSFYQHGFGNTYIILRQFMVFGYGFLIYVIFNQIYSLENVKNNLTKYLFYFALLCLVSQIIYLIFCVASKGINPFFRKYYLSPIVILGLLVMSAFVLAKINNRLLKFTLFFVIFLVSLTTGHDSAYLSIGFILMVYLFINFEKRLKTAIVIAVILMAISLVLFIPSFSDVNMQWRLIFWEDSFNKIVKNYFFFGDGFGIQYASDETIIKLNDLMSPINGPKIIGDDKYMCAPHNSFISMAIHLGLVSIALLFYPLKSLFLDINKLMNKEVLFLFLSLISMVVFASFNVILELPHSSSIFWIVYFGLIFKLNENLELRE